MGCGPSKTPGETTVSGGASGEIKPSPVNDNSSTVQTVQNNNLSEKQSGAVPEITKSDAGNRTVEERNSSVRTNTETKSTQMTILHFNDVYNIEPREKEPVGGAARFATKVASLRHLNPLIVFSGDCLNPSTSKFVLTILKKLSYPRKSLYLSFSCIIPVNFEGFLPGNQTPLGHFAFNNCVFNMTIVLTYN